MEENEKYFTRAHPFPSSTIDKSRYPRWRSNIDKQRRWRWKT